MNCFVDGYDRPCMRECYHADPVSPGRVDDAEVLCRAGYTMHNKGGNPAVSLIRANELAIGELSVWRLEHSASAKNLSAMVDLLRQRTPRGRQPQELLWVFGLPAGELRNLIDECPICAVDDTDCGGDWERHPKHCTLGGCSDLGFQNLANPDDESLAFHALRRALVEAFRRNELWRLSNVTLP